MPVTLERTLAQSHYYNESMVDVAWYKIGEGALLMCLIKEKQCCRGQFVGYGLHYWFAKSKL